MRYEDSPDRVNDQTLLSEKNADGGEELSYHSDRQALLLSGTLPRERRVDAILLDHC